jgi:high-affinity iron transporter
MATMLINSVVIVLREVIEAALMVSVLLAASRLLRLGTRWLVFALALGLIGATMYGQFLDLISELFEGVGQELFNALLQFAVFLSLAVVAFLVARQHGKPTDRDTILPAMMASAVAFGVTREGSEILIYVSGFVQINEFLSSVGVGSLAGAAIGFSVGVLFYYLLLALPARRALLVSLLLLGLAAAGMSAQATGLLIQADWISVAGPIWNSSGFIAEDSMPGQLLYALIGYEACTSAIDVSAYVASILIMALSVLAGWSVFAIKGAESR